MRLWIGLHWESLRRSIPRLLSWIGEEREWKRGKPQPSYLHPHILDKSPVQLAGLLDTATNKTQYNHLNPGVISSLNYDWIACLQPCTATCPLPSSCCTEIPTDKITQAWVTTKNVMIGEFKNASAIGTYSYTRGNAGNVIFKFLTIKYVLCKYSKEYYS